MTSPMDKVCIDVSCHWKGHCSVYFKTSDELHRQYIRPEHNADACPFYQSIPRKWGIGPEEAND
jgi:hypothetical protein